MIDLSGKKILFIAPKFYSYHTQIIHYMESKNALVTFYPEDIYTPLYRAAKKLLPFLARAIKKRYLDGILESVSPNAYDTVFVIRGGILTPDAMETLKTKLPNAKFVMYQWDSNQQSNYEPIISYFDHVKTFDKEDAKRYGLEYLPLFYAHRYKEIAEHKQPKQYDIVFYGAYHSDRLEIVKFIDAFCQANGLTFKHHLYITKMALFRLLCFGILKFKDLDYLKTYSVGMDEILNVYKKSFATLDIELNIQFGLTMRTFEALGAGLKLITTNKNIQDEPFYNDQNITILDRNHLHIDLDFFKTDFLSDLAFERYLFENWFNNVFEEDKR